MTFYLNHYALEHGSQNFDLFFQYICYYMLNSNIHTLFEEYLKYHIVYEFSSAACNNKYIGKTDRNFGTRVQEHSDLDKKSPVYNHLLKCEHFNYVVNLHSLPPSNNSLEYLERVKITVYDNAKISDNSQNWVELCFSERLHIKWSTLKLNCGIKVTKELVLFS